MSFFCVRNARTRVASGGQAARLYNVARFYNVICLAAAVALAGCASFSPAEIDAGALGVVATEPPQRGTYNEGGSGDWLEFVMKAAADGYAKADVSKKYVLDKPAVLAGVSQLMQARSGALWIGHSTFLVRIGGRTILTDPVFSERASPVGFSGPKRYFAAALAISELPPIDAVVVSHNHYDHFDVTSLSELGARFPKAALLIPKGNRRFVQQSGFRHIHEVEAGQHVTVGGIKLLALPAYHQTSRSGFDAFETRALGYSMRSVGGSSIYFAGDTAYGPVFAQIRRTFGRHDLALVPIGDYAPPEQVRHVHATPEEAIHIAADLGAKAAIGMHWGTFPLSDVPVFEPPQRFLRAGRHGQVQPVVLRIGESYGTRHAPGPM